MILEAFNLGPVKGWLRSRLPSYELDRNLNRSVVEFIGGQIILIGRKGYNFKVFGEAEGDSRVSQTASKSGCLLGNTEGGM